MKAAPTKEDRQIELADSGGIAVFASPIGAITVRYTEGGVDRVFLPGEHAPSAVRDRVRPAFLDDLARELTAYFGGEPVNFALPLSLGALTPFQIQVLEQCRLIPHGEVRTYGWLAARVGRPGAARAVGQAMARNPLPLLIPCHRVVAASGLGGFGGGLALKARLLALEASGACPNIADCP
jgi:methylated-DNA-[protein]-cysteine S-methyltransferase